MDNQSLVNVLGLLRRMQNLSNTVSSAEMIKSWGIGTPDEATILKVAAYVMEQSQLAKATILNSKLSEEAKDGIMVTLDGLEQAFTLAKIQTSPKGHVGNITSGIALLAVLLSSQNVEEQRASPPEIDELLAEINELQGALTDEDLDPLVRETAQRHLNVLSTLLRQIPILGLEAALTAYFALLMKIRRSDIDTSPKSRDKLKPIWATIEGWGAKLASIDKVWNVGARLAHVKRAQQLLTYGDDEA